MHANMQGARLLGGGMCAKQTGILGVNVNQCEDVSQCFFSRLDVCVENAYNLEIVSDIRLDCPHKNHFAEIRVILNANKKTIELDENRKFANSTRQKKHVRR